MLQTIKQLVSYQQAVDSRHKIIGDRKTNDAQSKRTKAEAKKNETVEGERELGRAA